MAGMNSTNQPARVSSPKKRAAADIGSDDDNAAQVKVNKKQKSEAGTRTTAADTAALSASGLGNAKDKKIVSSVVLKVSASRFKVFKALKDKEEPVWFYDDDDKDVKCRAMHADDDQARPTTSISVKKAEVATRPPGATKAAVKSSATPVAKSVTKPATKPATKSVTRHVPNVKQEEEDVDLHSGSDADNKQRIPAENIIQADYGAIALANGHTYDTSDLCPHNPEDCSGDECNCDETHLQEGSQKNKKKKKCKKVTLSMLPLELSKRENWRTFGATFEEWCTSKINPLKLTPSKYGYGARVVWSEMFGNRGDQAIQRFTAYKNAMAATALMQLKSYFDRYTDHEDRYERYHSMQECQKYTENKLNGNRFMYEDSWFVGGKLKGKGSFHSESIANVLAVYYDRIDGLAIWLEMSQEKDPKPIGGLALASAAVERAYRLYANGRMHFVKGSDGDPTIAADVPHDDVNDNDDIAKSGRLSQDIRVRPTKIRPVPTSLGTMTTSDVNFSKDTFVSTVEGYAVCIQQLKQEQIREVLDNAKLASKRYKTSGSLRSFSSWLGVPLKVIISDSE
ncbi:hypothetical protein CERSUDRAFT_98686 [Gelatoporia subvermispora B]|uniref:Uncharacterized protein n=1 Tax=Ceriporiopsis subvermispora (strain B) TaxID=914234 RepID=M2R2F7_CERS8|nr:hypothetical protein CERSUDRAFT_98686 [Gelatoporia subvermispora B]